MNRISIFAFALLFASSAAYAWPDRHQPRNDDPPPPPFLDGQPVYSPEECAGPIINGVCHGAIVPHSAVPKVCHGEMLNGMCTGPMF